MGLLIPMVKAMKSNQERYINLVPMQHRPGRRAVTKGKEDLFIALTSCGRYDTTVEFQDKDNFTTILARLKELVHGNDMEDLRSSYRRDSGKALERSHKINMAHIEAALTSIINKNSCESAIKAFLDLQVQHGRAVSKQADGFKEEKP